MQWRKWLGGLVLAITLFLFVRFFVLHPAYLQALIHIRFSTILWVFGLNAVLLLVLVVVQDLTLRLCGTRLAWKEQALLTSYSSIANFFGPLQSGPGVRALYLKAKHNVRLRDYTLASLVYYTFYAFINAIFLFGFSRPWYQTLGALIVIGFVSWLVIRRFANRPTTDGMPSGFRLEPKLLVSLLVATFVQVSLLALCYFIEVRSIDSVITLRQALIYSGAANFALFVSLTPDAIGFRESFLVLSQRLHHIGTAVIISANVIDRAVYVVFLAALFAVILATHAHDRFTLSEAQPRASSNDQ